MNANEFLYLNFKEEFVMCEVFEVQSVISEENVEQIGQFKSE